MFLTVSPSIIRSLRLYIQHQVYVIQVLWLLASWNEIKLQFQNKIKLRYCASGWFYYRYIAFHNTSVWSFSTLRVTLLITVQTADLRQVFFLR
jgi:hypothetical protein